MQRKGQALSPSEVARRKKLIRERVRKCRQRQKEKKAKNSSQDQDVSQAYQTPQALGKALGKVSSRVLPQSPRKRKAVVFKLAHASGFLRKKKCTRGNRGLPKETVNLVKVFFQLDSISRQALGRKDFVTVRENNTKHHIQKRHLLWSLRECYSIFMKENPTTEIGFSKFCSLRPVNVLLSAAMPRDVCLCKYHENIKMLCESLHKEIDDFPMYPGTFAENFVCNPESELCMLGNCKKCAKCPSLLQKIRSSAGKLDEHATWYQWEHVKQMVQGKKGKSLKRVKKIQKVLKEGTVDDLLVDLKVQLPSFLEHVFVKRQQARFFKEKLEHLTEEEAVVQVDFAENYSCEYQGEVQSAHWSQDQVTLFTVAIWQSLRAPVAPVYFELERAPVLFYLGSLLLPFILN